VLQQRIDFYTNIHKGIRRNLFELSARAGSTDPTDESSLRALETAFITTVSVLRDHATTENTYYHPLIQKKLPGLFSSVSREHDEQEPIVDDLERRLAQIRMVLDPLSRERLLLEFYRALNRFVARTLEHLDEEEDRIMPELWGHATDEELGMVMGAMAGSFTTQRLTRDAELMLPAMNAPERARFLGMLKAKFPEPLYRSVADVAHRVLAEAEFKRLPPSSS
jgi:hemerythrin-like domain-containing protein